MQESIMTQIGIYIQQSIADYHKDPQINIFDRFIQRCQLYYDQPAHSLAEIKLKMNKKLKGDIFEHFCLKYCQTCLCFPEVWLLGDLPEEILKKLNLKRQDFGIDLIARDQDNKYYAIQAKYRKHTNRKEYSALTWKQLSTFHALTSRTGPYQQHIVITNADYCRQMGRKTKKDKSICYRSLRGIKLDQWMTLAGMPGRRLVEDKVVKLQFKPRKKKKELSLTELREKRLAYLEKTHSS